MSPEEYSRAMGMLHPLEGLEMFLTVIKDRLKTIEPKRRGDVLLCLQSAERHRRAVLDELRGLLVGSESVESNRRERENLKLTLARTEGQAEGLERALAAITEQRASLANEPMTKIDNLTPKRKAR